MEFKYFKGFSYTKSLIALCLMQQLFACSSEDAAPATTTSPPAPPMSGTVLSWEKPGFREDDTDLPVAEIGGYRVYYGTTTGVYQNEIDVESNGTASGFIAVDNLSLVAGTYYFVVTTYDTEGRESVYSPEVEIII